jgi:electron-transferring-flavoprotein dehydrogenase
MGTEELPARDAMGFDVVIVGAGPAGLGAAIRLKQLNSELTVVVVEKGSEVGAHILSGAVIDPIGLDALLPGWRLEADTPIKTPVTDDRFYGPSGALRVPNFFHAAADVEPRQLHCFARQCVPLAGDQGGSARR